VSRIQLHYLQPSSSRAINKDSNNLIAVIPDLSGLKGILRNFLNISFNTSSIRRKEGGDSIIKTTCLHMAPNKGGDFTLSIQIKLNIKLTIAQLISTGDNL